MLCTRFVSLDFPAFERQGLEDLDVQRGRGTGCRCTSGTDGSRNEGDVRIGEFVSESGPLFFIRRREMLVAVMIS